MILADQCKKFTFLNSRTKKIMFLLRCTKGTQKYIWLDEFLRVMIKMVAILFDCTVGLCIFWLFINAFHDIWINKPNVCQIEFFICFFRTFCIFEIHGFCFLSNIWAHSHPAKSEECCSTQLLDGDGTFNVTGIDQFIKEAKLAECGLSYAVVSIMGPQSSGMHSSPQA